MIPELLEKLYFFEIERRDKLNRQATFTLAVATAYLTLIGHLLSTISIEKSVPWLFTLLVLSLAAFITFVEKFWSFFGHESTYLTSADAISERYYKALEYDNAVEHASEVEILSRSIVESMARSTTKNRAANIRKAGLLLEANQRISAALLFGFIAFGAKLFSAS